MDIILRLFSMAVSLFLFSIVIYMMIRRRLNESNSILWLFIGVIILVFGFFPDLLIMVSNLLGIDYPPALLFLLSSVVVIMMVFRITVYLSQMDAKVSELVIVVSILKEENERLSKRVSQIEEANIKE